VGAATAVGVRAEVGAGGVDVGSAGVAVGAGFGPQAASANTATILRRKKAFFKFLTPVRFYV
jgi:hypothetical protein